MLQASLFPTALRTSLVMASMSSVGSSMLHCTVWEVRARVRLGVLGVRVTLGRFFSGREGWGGWGTTWMEESSDSEESEGGGRRKRNWQASASPSSGELMGLGSMGSHVLETLLVVWVRISCNL